jgi:hypothetical protein
VSDPRLEGMAEDLLDEATVPYETEGRKARLFSEGLYRAASWEHERRVIYKAEAMHKGTNTRFLLTTRTDDPEDLYGFYARRGESENWIKDLKLHMKADRLSCHRFIANQFRLVLHACAYWLMDALRRRLVASGARRMQLDTLRLTLISRSEGGSESSSPRFACTWPPDTRGTVYGTPFRVPSEAFMNDPG